MIHFLNLHPGPFKNIKSGKKDVEMRLYDDKRRLIKVDDQITFTNNQTGETLSCTVLDIKVFKNFEALYSSYNKTRIGYEEWEDANPEDMKQYYPEDEMQSNGVCAIEIKLN